jgi:glycosyltransferase involved in cell wall biosynthesis
MKLLFITRTYPPLVGGMEKFASDFYENYRRKGDIDLIANSGGKKTLPFFLIKVAFFLMLYSKRYDIIHIYDAVLSPLVFIIKSFSKTKVSFTVNGLDIVYSKFGYQKFMPFFLSKADKVFAISRYTMEQCVLRGLPKEKLMVIPVGLDFDAIEFFSEEKRSKIMSRFNIPVKDMKILMTVGRLVKRKGHAWFLEHVLKNLPNDYSYLIAGDGPERDTIVNISRKLNLAKRVHLLGRVSDDEKNCLYQIADLFVMPNIHMDNDQEGFGIVLLEAGRYGLPVVTSNIEGIRDVVLDKKTGRLVEEKDAQGFVDEIMTFDPDRSSISASLASFFNWDVVINKYYTEFRELLSG